MFKSLGATFIGMQVRGCMVNSYGEEGYKMPPPPFTPPPPSLPVISDHSLRTKVFKQVSSTPQEVKGGLVMF